MENWYKLIFCVQDNEGCYYYSSKPFKATLEQVQEQMQLQGACGYEEVFANDR